MEINGRDVRNSFQGGVNRLLGEALKGSNLHGGAPQLTLRVRRLVQDEENQPHARPIPEHLSNSKITLEGDDDVDGQKKCRLVSENLLTSSINNNNDYVKGEKEMEGSHRPSNDTDNSIKDTDKRVEDLDDEEGYHSPRQLAKELSAASNGSNTKDCGVPDTSAGDTVEMVRCDKRDLSDVELLSVDFGSSNLTPVEGKEAALSPISFQQTPFMCRLIEAGTVVNFPAEAATARSEAAAVAGPNLSATFRMEATKDDSGSMLSFVRYLRFSK